MQTATGGIKDRASKRKKEMSLCLAPRCVISQRGSAQSINLREPGRGSEWDPSAGSGIMVPDQHSLQSLSHRAVAEVILKTSG